MNINIIRGLIILGLFFITKDSPPPPGGHSNYTITIPYSDFFKIFPKILNNFLLSK